MRVAFVRSVDNRRVIFDADLAVLYGVTTKALNQAVRRNRDRFPAELLFVLDASERLEVVTTCDHLHQLKFSRALPTAYTQHGAIMVATVLKTKRAVDMSVYVVRAFIVADLQQLAVAPARPRHGIGFTADLGD